MKLALLEIDAVGQGLDAQGYLLRSFIVACDEKDGDDMFLRNSMHKNCFLQPSYSSNAFEFRARDRTTALPKLTLTSP